MAIFRKNKRNSGFMNEIRCDEPSYLIWKWHPAGVQLGEGNRENAIRWGSSLRVKDGEVAVFVYSQYDGIMQDYIEGPCDMILTTANLPVFARLIGLAYEGGTPFQAEVYFVNLARIIQVKFGVPFFDVYDPRFADFGIPIAIRGTVSFRISDYKEFIKLHRLNNFDLDGFQGQIRDAINRYVKDCVANALAIYGIPVIQIESKTAQINDMVECYICERLGRNFGVLVSGIDIAAIEIDKSSEGYLQLMAVTRNLMATKIQAETTDYVERLRIQREEGQYAQHKAAQTINMGAFQLEKQAEVGVAGAYALGQMGVNGAGNVNSGSSDDSFNMAAMIAGMAVGGTIGRNIAGTMNSMMSGINQPIQPEITPPIPTILYYVAVNGHVTGPFDVSALTQMAATGQFTGSSLVWKNGMTQWVKAEGVDELKNLFNTVPPIPPKKN